MVLVARLCFLALLTASTAHCRRPLPLNDLVGRRPVHQWNGVGDDRLASSSNEDDEVLLAADQPRFAAGFEAADRKHRLLQRVGHDVDEESAESQTAHLGECPDCMMREEAKQARIERIKTDFLEKLGLTEPPNITAADVERINPHLHTLLDKWGFRTDNYLSDEPDRGSYEVELPAAKTERVFVFATKPPTYLGLPENKPISFFKFSSQTLENHVDNATMHFFLRRPSNFEHTEEPVPLIARLFEIHHANGTRKEVMHKLFKKDMRFDDGHWESFHITKLVRRWFMKPERNLGIVVEVNYGDENLVVMPGTPEADTNVMYVEVALSENEKRRRKRAAPTPVCTNGEDSCCRLPLQITFADFGWNWIQVPQTYNAHYCAGKCRFRHLQRHQHTHLVQQAHAAGAQTHSPCCHGTLYSPLQVIYYNPKHELVVAMVPDMVVQRCGCA